MAVPTFTGAYSLKIAPVGQAVVWDVRFANGVSGIGWSADATKFEVHTLPPGFTFDGVFNLGGASEVLMDYYISIRAGNADGFADWEELRWAAPFGQSSFLKLFGPSRDWPTLLSFGGAAAVLTVDRVTNDGNAVFINDIGQDGTASDYDSHSIGTTFSIPAATSVFLRSRSPGVEVIINTAL